MDDTIPASTSPPDAPVLLFDGVCALCNNSVRIILRFDKVGAMRFSALDGDHGRRVVERHPELAAIDSVVLVENPGPGERIHVKSDAFLGIAEYLGGPWRTLRILRLLPRPIRDTLYSLVARSRYRIFGRYDTCPVPPPEVRARFLA